jgi:hypothetical protein
MRIHAGYWLAFLASLAGGSQQTPPAAPPPPEETRLSVESLERGDAAN